MVQLRPRFSYNVKTLMHWPMVLAKHSHRAASRQYREPSRIAFQNGYHKELPKIIVMFPRTHNCEKARLIARLFSGTMFALKRYGAMVLTNVVSRACATDITLAFA